MVDTQRCLFTAFDILNAVGGEIPGNLPNSGILERLEIHSVRIDSRECVPGSLFVPLKGEQTDGHFFLKSAIEKGSTLCFVNRHYYDKSKAEIGGYQSTYAVAVIIVEDTLNALQALAKSYIDKFINLVKIGITGSNGKTTTKELLGAILNEQALAVVSPGNLNSDIGLPLSCFEVGPEHEFAVFEMGMNRVGEIEILVNIVNPDFAVITNIGPAHVGLLGSVKAIALEKRKIFTFSSENSRGFLSENEPFFALLAEGNEQRIVKFGPNSTPGYISSRSLGLDGTIMQFEQMEIHLPLVGVYNLQNALCAIRVGQVLGISGDRIKAGLEKARPLFGRGEVIKGDITIIQDCYNANTVSIQKALDFVDTLSFTGRKILVLGSMKELGDATDSEHKLVGISAADSTSNIIFFFGEESEAAYNAAKERGHPDVSWTTSFEELAAAVTGRIAAGDLILLKGSRSMELERLTDILRRWDFGLV